MQDLPHLIDGALVHDADRAIDVHEPATARVYARVPDADESTVDRAVTAAQRAFPAWARTPATERSRLLLSLADRIDANLDRLANAESKDTGKPVSLARSVDIPRSSANLRFFATAILHTKSDFHDSGAGGTPGGVPAINYTKRAPRGVAACISPWNLPLYLLTWKIAPALATGNTVVAKPSEVTPATASILAQLALDAGFPAGVLNIVHGSGARTGSALVEHPAVHAVTFTGSTAVGAQIAQICARTCKRVSLELGGKNPFLIFDDADLDHALPACARAAFANQGQICLCGSRVLAHQSVYERTIEALTSHARALTPSDPADPDTTFGSLVSAQHLDKVAGFVDRARELGGLIHAGGERPGPDSLPQRCALGYFYLPTVISNLPNTCDVIQEEIFGPVVTVQPFKNEAEAVRLANSTRYGLAASIWTESLSRAHRVANAIDSGIVWVNCWMVRDLRTPFGGAKASGVGREGGDEALRFFTEPKNVCVAIPQEHQP